jgi:hypothetical protein
MGAPSIKRDAVKYANRVSKMLKHGRIPTVSVAIDISTKEIIGVGIDHSVVAARLTEVPEGTWEVIEVPVWR